MTGTLEKAEGRRTAVALAIIVLLVLGSCILLDRPLVRGDGLAYFMWLDSLARDGDLDLANQAAKFAHVNTYHVFVYWRTGHHASVFPFGSAMLLVPFYWLAMLLDRLPILHINDAYFLQHQGATFVYSLFPMLGANLYAVASVVLTYLSARKLASVRISMLAAMALFFGTPLLYYSSVEPLSSHVAGTFAVSVLLYLFVHWWVKRESNPSGREQVLWTAAGLAAGMAAVVRWQLMLVALPLGVLLLWQRRLRLLASFALGCLAIAWLVPYSWWRMFGSPWVIPAAEQNRAAFLVWPVHVGKVLFSGEKGLFAWAPLTALAVLGWIPLYRKDRTLGLTLTGIFLLQALINGSVYDWWAGWGFGMRRMVELYPVFALGLAALLATRLTREKMHRAYQIGVHLLTAGSTAFALILLLSHLNFINTVVDRPQGDTAVRELRYQIRQSTPHITWLVIKDHYGPWAWHKPGP